MRTINVRETHEKLSSLLDAVLDGDEIVIVRNGKLAAQLTAPLSETVQFPDRSPLRAELPACGERASETVRNLRDEARF